MTCNIVSPRSIIKYFESNPYSASAITLLILGLFTTIALCQYNISSQIAYGYIPASLILIFFLRHAYQKGKELIASNSKETDRLMQPVENKELWLKLINGKTVSITVSSTWTILDLKREGLQKMQQTGQAAMEDTVDDWRIVVGFYSLKDSELAVQTTAWSKSVNRINFVRIKKQ